MNNRQASSEENKKMCAVNINRFLDMARQHLLDQIAATVESAAVSA